jgi:hypothetical protein
MRFNLIAFLIISSGAFYSCSQKEKTDTNEQSDNDEWAEMDSFHMIMAEAFHPYKDSANLEPVKRLADEMAQQAESWASAPLPDKVNNEEVKAQLNKLKADSRALSDLIKGSASDEAIGTSLQSLHDNFHHIMEQWNSGEHEHKHE